MPRRPAPPSIPKARLVQLYREALMNDVPLAHVEERVAELLQRVTVTSQIESVNDEARQKKLQRQVAWPVRLLSQFGPFALVSMGLIFVLTATWPIISYFIFTAPELRHTALLAPIPNEQVLDVMPQIITQTQVQAKTNETAEASPSDGPQIQPTIVNTDLDYINLSKWFPTLTIPEASQQEQQVAYKLEIPAVDVKEAAVKVGGTNLDHSLIQYPGTAMPGDLGSPVIFGHSVLRQFYNPSEKNPRRYFSIFSKIMTLKTGDKIYLTYDNVKYTYIVRKRDVVKPEDTFILEQHYDGRFLKLVTCVPEGTYLERGVITAELVTGE